MDIPPPPPAPGHVPQPPQQWSPYRTPYGNPCAPPEPPKTNGLAIGSMVAGIVCCLPPLGLILGVVALVQIKKTGHRGKGMAVAGVVLSSISTLLVLTAIVTGGAADFWRGFRDAAGEAARTKSIDRLHRGDCFDAPGGDGLEGYVTDVRVVPCSGSHEGEVTGTFELEIPGPWPGEGEISAIAAERCWNIAGTYAMDTWAVPESVVTYYFAPDKRGWRLGDRSVTCSLSDDGDGTLDGPLLNDASMLDPHQAAYLGTANAVDGLLYGGPEADEVEDDPEGFRTWAIEVAAALEKGAEQLRSRTWPSVADKAVADRVAEFEAARKEWVTASEVTDDEDLFWTHHDAAHAALKTSTEISIREALVLETTPPKDYEDDTASEEGAAGDGTDA
ncbi:DUF4190 domain-containing protein [Streptomyces sannanensis]|uniref:DUF4190 domain-containing protein n=1 Tax=Streptomyces sannanensis TaxID=285536 RepID=A0ABP6SFG1_9ACTN